MVTTGRIFASFPRVPWHEDDHDEPEKLPDTWDAVCALLGRKPTAEEWSTAWRTHDPETGEVLLRVVIGGRA